MQIFVIRKNYWNWLFKFFYLYDYVINFKNTFSSKEINNNIEDDLKETGGWRSIYMEPKLKS